MTTFADKKADAKVKAFFDAKMANLRAECVRDLDRPGRDMSKLTLAQLWQIAKDERGE